MYSWALGPPFLDLSCYLYSHQIRFTACFSSLPPQLTWSIRQEIHILLYSYLCAPESTHSSSKASFTHCFPYPAFSHLSYLESFHSSKSLEHAVCASITQWSQLGFLSDVQALWMQGPFLIHISVHYSADTSGVHASQTVCEEEPASTNSQSVSDKVLKNKMK
jgi:hypothetical protein